MTSGLFQYPGSLLVEIRMAGQMLSVEPTSSQRKTDTQRSASIANRRPHILHEVTLGDYSYVVNDAQITYTTIEGSARSRP